MAETRIDGLTRREPVTEQPDPEPPAKAPRQPSREAAARLEHWVATTPGSSSAAEDAAWAAVANAAPLATPAVGSPSCAAPLATPDNAASFARRGVPLGLALQEAALVSVDDLEKFIDDYVHVTATRPELAGLNADARRQGPAIFAKRLDSERAEVSKQEEARRMSDRMQLMVVRPPAIMEQHVAAGRLVIPVAEAANAIAKLVPIVGELIVATEVVSGRSLCGLGFDVPASERALSAALLVTPYAAMALRSGVRGGAELIRLARATGHSTEETRALCAAVLTLEKNKEALRAGFVAAKSGRALTTAQREAFVESNGALQALRGAAARSRLDATGQSMMTRAEKAVLPTFAENAGGVQRTVDEALAIAKKNGVEMPGYIKVVADPTVKIKESFAEYELIKNVREDAPLQWGTLVKSEVVVRVHPSVLRSDEAIVGVLQHESYELEQLRMTMNRRGTLRPPEIRRMINSEGDLNLHGQAWDIADSRVLIMRERDAGKRAVLENQLEKRLAGFNRLNGGRP